MSCVQASGFRVAVLTFATLVGCSSVSAPQGADPCDGDPLCVSLKSAAGHGDVASNPRTTNENRPDTPSQEEGALSSRPESSTLTCSVGNSYCDTPSNQCFACCDGAYTYINSCTYGVYYYCDGAGPYDATSCWPVGKK